MTILNGQLDRIVLDPAVLNGKPIVRGTRIPVSLILNLFRHWYSFDQIVEAYPTLTKDDVAAALAYAEFRMDREEALVLAP